MSAKTGSEIPITADDLAAQLKLATTLLTSVSYAPRKEVATLLLERQQGGEKPKGFAFSGGDTPATPKSMAILKVATQVNKGGELLEENINTTLNAVRTGLQIGLHLGSLFAKFSGLELLSERNSKRQLTQDSEQVQWKNLMEVQAAITLFCAAYYIVWRLANYKMEELSGEKVTFEGLPERLSLGGQVSALSSAIFHWGSYLGTTQTGLEFLKMTQVYFQAILDDIKAQAGAMEANASVFTEKNYRLEKTTFAINGFHGEIHGAGRVVEFKPVSLDKIVGNHDAKRHAFRIAQYLVAYDFDRKLNPFVKLGAFPYVYLYKGRPGTGKTMLIGATLTMVNEYCQGLDLPFRPHPLPNAIVSTFQGGSAENMENWMSVLRNPNEIIVAPIDDAENTFESRTRQGVSSGVREVIGTFLRETEGATAIIRGNALIVFATNIADQMDNAVMSRVQARTDVDGAETREDWIDQIRLWTDEIGSWNETLVDLKWPANYTHLSAQRVRDYTEGKREKLVMFRDTRLVEVHDRLIGEGFKPDQFDYYGRFYAEVEKQFPLFSSRDERNIKTAVMKRLYDFDFPKEWLTERGVFVDKDYDTKLGMIAELAKGSLGPLKFSEMMFEEVVRYLNTAIEILEGGTERRIGEALEEMQIRKAALERLNGSEHPAPSQ